MKRAEQFHLLLPLRDRLALRVIADQDGYNMAWLIRAILKEYKKRHKEPPRVQNRIRFEEPPVRFNMVFHGDKAVWISWAKAYNYELAPVVREIVRQYLTGSFQVDFDDLKSVKEEKQPISRGFTGKKTSNCYAYAQQIQGVNYRPSDYRPVNHQANLNLMHLGLRNKKKSYVREAIRWFLKRNPDYPYEIAQ